LNKLFIDVETRSRCDLKAAGARRYAADPSTQITTAAWKPQGGQLFNACNIRGLEQIGHNTMADFVRALNWADHIVAHHINFDANIVMSTMGPCGLHLGKLDCTMARAQRMSLPGGLDELCMALGVPGKSADGHRLVMATCKPKKDGTFNEDPAIFRQLLAYNDQDIRCLESVDRMLPPLPPDELEIWRRTWRKNAYGLPLDLELCYRIAAKREQIEQEIGAELFQLTGGAVTAITQRQRILEWLQSRGVNIPNTQRATIETWLDMERLPFEPWRVLSIMYESGGSAPTKAQTLLDRHVAGFFQDATRYFGARSGRGTSEGVNMFNIARPSGKYEPNHVIEQLKLEGRTPTGRIFNNTELSDVLRGAIVAPSGEVVIDADLSNIELRLSLWYANDHQKLELLRQNKDLYAATAGNAMGIPNLTKTSHPKERQAYKKVVLSGGYQIGVERLFNAFKVDKDLSYEYRRDITYAQVAAIHSGYRDDNVPLQMTWRGLDNAARSAIQYRGVKIPACDGKLVFFWRKDVDLLELHLPSGRIIPHYRPAIDQESGEMTFWRARYGRMMQGKMYGGSLLEIACQSAARDILTGVESAIERELPDVRLILDIYDSVVALAPERVAEARLEHILNIMRRVPGWANGLPLNGEGTIGKRMEK
jgi:DNA polymerase